MNLVNRTPDFDNILQVLRCQQPSRSTLFEFFMNGKVYGTATGKEPPAGDYFEFARYMAESFAACGYDYANVTGAPFSFHTREQRHKDTLSLNEGASIVDWESYEAYPWPALKEESFSYLADLESSLPGNMKMMTAGPGGILENVISLVGYDNLCFLLYEEPELVRELFDRVGSTLLEFYTYCAQYKCVGIIMANDDWGFNTQTMISPDNLRTYVFPWYKKIVAMAHSNGKPAVLHSCGNLTEVMDDIIDDMGFDGKHSYEDVILPVEDCYRRWGGRIAVLGGLDVDFLVRSTPEEIKARARGMLELSREKGGYALGSGNSIPEYIPLESYFAMTSVIMEA